MKKDTAVVLASTKDYLYATSNVLIGLTKCSPDFATDIILFNDGIDEIYKNKLNQLTKNIIYKLYNNDYFISKTNLKIETLPRLKRFSLLAYARYEIFDLLKYYKKILYIDCDMLIQKDISKVKKFGPISLQRHNKTLAYCFNTDKKEIEGVDTSLYSYMNSYIYINDNLNHYEILTDECYQLTQKYILNSTLPDLAIISILLYKYNITPNEAPRSIHALHTAKESYDSCMVHPINGLKWKFWSNPLMRQLYPLWQENYEEWIKMGGQKYEGPQYYLSDFPKEKDKIFKNYKNELFYRDLYLKNKDRLPLNILPNISANKSYLQFFIKNIDEKIHYEILEKKYVCLHCESEEFRKSFYLKNIFKNIYQKIYNEKYKVDYNEQKLSITIVSCEKNIFDDLLFLITTSYPFFMVNEENDNLNNKNLINNYDSRYVQNKFDSKFEHITTEENLLNFSILHKDNISLHSQLIQINNTLKNIAHYLINDSIKYSFICEGKIITMEFPKYYINDYIQQQIIRFGTFYEFKQLKKISAYLPKNAVIIDAGANIGNHTLFFAKIIQAKKIYSFEPIPLTFNILENNIKINSVTDKVNLFNFGLGEIETFASVKRAAPSNIGATYLETQTNDRDNLIKIKTIDSLNLEHVDLIKVDVEGMEISLLKGAAQLIKKFHPIIYVECHNGHETIQNELNSYGYTLEHAFSKKEFLFK